MGSFGIMPALYPSRTTDPGGAGIAQIGPTQFGLIPRSVLFGNPDYARVRLSPSGEQIAYLAPLEGVLNLWVAPANAPLEGRPVTREAAAIGGFAWTFSPDVLLYLRDERGDENWHVYRLNLESGETLDLTPGLVAARIEKLSPSSPREVVLATNARHPQLHDLYRVDLETAESELVFANPGYAAFLLDAALRVRVAFSLRASHQEIVEILPNGEARDLLRVPPEDTLSFGLAGVNSAGTKVYLFSSISRDTAGLCSLEIDTGRLDVLAADPRCDVDQVLFHPQSGDPLAAAFTYDRTSWRSLQPEIEGDFRELARTDPGDLRIVSQSAQDQHWIVRFSSDQRSPRLALWDRRSRRAVPLFSEYKQIDKFILSAMHPRTLRSRDDLSLMTYVSLPRGSDFEGRGLPDRPLPMVLLVHGGPWSRDRWGYEPMTQFLANRGYAVLSVNFRGSLGFGKRVANAGDLEWGRRMHDDLLDGVEWAVSEGIAIEQKVAIMGISYGGFAAMVGLALTPRVFACGVNVVGPARLSTLLQQFPQYWAPIMDLFKARVGDWTTEQGRAALDAFSPSNHAAAIVRPLLIVQGERDVRVPQSESAAIVEELQRRKVPVTYASLPDQGHMFSNPENNQALFALIEAFLQSHLGGACEPFGREMASSRVRIAAGAGSLPGLENALSLVGTTEG